MGYDADSPANPPAPHADALQILHADHAAIRALFAELDALAEQPTGAADRHGLVARIGALLRAHADIETTVFYPALANHVDAGLLGRALADHADIDALLQRVAAAEPGSEIFVEQFAALAGTVHAHLFEEERSVLPHAAALDLAGLGAQMAQRRATLMAEQGVD
jgi:Hemerythrin HHE cation binding domain